MYFFSLLEKYLCGMCRPRGKKGMEKKVSFVLMIFLSALKCRSILLGTKGFDVPHLSEKLDRLNTTKTFEPLEPVRETDIQVMYSNGI